MRQFSLHNPFKLAQLMYPLYLNWLIFIVLFIAEPSYLAFRFVELSSFGGAQPAGLSSRLLYRIPKRLQTFNWKCEFPTYTHIRLRVGKSVCWLNSRLATQFPKGNLHFIFLSEHLLHVRTQTMYICAWTSPVPRLFAGLEPGLLGEPGKVDVLVPAWFACGSG